MSHPILDNYHRKLSNLDGTRKRMEVLFDLKRIKLRDVHSIYEGLFLRAVAEFENYCEELFFDVFYGKIRYSSSKIVCKISSGSRKAIREIVLQNENYLDWLPIKRTIDRVNMYFFRRGGAGNCGRPFLDLSDGEKSQLKTILTIRHAIAHAGGHAMREFKRTVIGSQLLLPIERKPAGFLRSRIASAPPQSRFEVYLALLIEISKTILGKPIS